MERLSHAFYIYSSYGISAIVLAAIIAWVYFDSRARKKELARLEAAGIRRRSAQTDESKPA
jgi:heme exporter protein D